MYTIHTGTIAHVVANPFEQERSLQIYERGALLVDDDGYIKALDDAGALIRQYTKCRRIDHGDAWLIPGLIDLHCHFPQYYAIGSPGNELLDWLDNSIYPAERAFENLDYSQRTAREFIDRLLRSGTTTAVVFGSHLLAPNHALLDAAERVNMGIVMGMTLMDRRVPEQLVRSIDEAYQDSEKLIKRCRRLDRFRYAVTPRFALSCSEAMLDMCSQLLKNFPDCYLHTHINENRAEIKAVKRAFPSAQNYLDIYEKAELLTDKTLLAHNIYADESELSRIAEIGCGVSHCPSSNLYLGSGLFPLMKHVKRKIKVGIGTDIGAGTHFSVWQEIADAYKIQQLQGMTLNAAQLLYLATLSGAEVLQIEHESGNFDAGKRADFFVLSPRSDGYLRERLDRCDSDYDQLFALLQIAGPQHVTATFLGGHEVYRSGH